MELSPNGEPVDKKPILTADGLIQTTNQTTNATNNSPTTTTLTASNLDIEILPVIYDIIRWYVALFVIYWLKNEKQNTFIIWINGIFFGFLYCIL